jgi:DNA (cytosine-5)-methyltransferase 1
VFVIGHLADWRAAGAVLFERSCLRGDPAPRRKAGAAASALTANGVGTCGVDDNQAQAGHLIAQDVGNCLTHRMHKGVNSDLNEGQTLVAFSCKDNGRDAVEECSPTLRAMGHGGSHANGGGQVAVAVSLRGRNGGGQLEVGGEQANTLRASQGGSDKAHIFDGSLVRRLTPIECERLQGFPDNYTRILWRGKPADQCPDGPRYKAIGNSMAVNVMRWIGGRIDLFEKLKIEGRI